MPVKTKVFPANFVSFSAWPLVLHVHASGSQVVDQLAIGLLGEKFQNSFRHLRPDLGHFLQLFLARLRQLVHRAEMIAASNCAVRSPTNRIPDA